MNIIIQDLLAVRYLTALSLRLHCEDYDRGVTNKQNSDIKNPSSGICGEDLLDSREFFLEQRPTNFMHKGQHEHQSHPSGQQTETITGNA